METWRLMITTPAPGAWNMAVDEAVLQSVGRRAAPPTLRLYAWQPACLSLGQAQSFKDVDLARLKDHGWDVVRRVTGGRAILHTDELTYSVIAPPDEPRVQGSVLESYSRLAHALLSAVRALGLPVSMEPDVPPPGAASGPVCFEVPSAYEIVAAGKKLIGSAQARKKEGVLQHGSLPLHGDLTRITQVLVYPDEATREDAARSLLAHATTFENAGGRRVEWQTAAQAFVSAFEGELDLKFEPAGLSVDEAARADELVANKYDHPDWTERS